MAERSIWLGAEIDEDKIKEIAKKQNRSVSNLINNLLKDNYDVLKNGIAVHPSDTCDNNLTEGAVE